MRILRIPVIDVKTFRFKTEDRQLDDRKYSRHKDRLILDRLFRMTWL